jgi:hypothetical protein
MDCLELVDKMITHTARIELDMNYSRFKVTLKESACDSEATIFNVPEGAIVIKLDQSIDLNRVFRGAYGECKRSDFIIIAMKDGQLMILHIEMKHARGNNTDIKKQLHGSRCFMHYMQELGRVFGQHQEFLRSAQHRFVSIKHSGLQKRKTRISRVTDTHDTPDKVLTISSPHHVEFAKISGGN